MRRISFGARTYNASIGRFDGVDPLAGKYSAWSPYNYTLDNLIRFMDPDGRDVYNINSSTGEISITKTKSMRHSYYVNDGNGNRTYIGSFKYNSKGLVQLPSSLQFNIGGNDVGFSVKKGQENRAYASGNAFASLIGAVANSGINDLTINQFSYSDGTSPGKSTSHKDGRNGDLRYLRNDKSGKKAVLGDPDVDINRQNQLNNSLHLFGWKDMISEKFNGNMLLNHTSSAKMRRIPSSHTDHLHLQGYSPNIQVDYFGGELQEITIKLNK